jgi:hypothetical protein
MIRTRSLVATLLLGSHSLPAVRPTPPSPNSYSGFLKDYSGLEQTKSESGKEVMRWRKAGFQNDGTTAPSRSSPLRSIRLRNPMNVSPSKPCSRYSTTPTRPSNPPCATACNRHRQPGPRTLQFRGAITGVGAEDQGLKPYEVIPIALVVASAQTASGHRTQNTAMFLESELIDVETGEPQLKVVRKVMGKTVNNETNPGYVR